MATTSLADVLIDDVTWSCATRARRAEWRQAIEELLEDGAFEPEPPAPMGPLRAYVTVHRAGIGVLLHCEDGRVAGRLELPQPVIAPLLREYMTIVKDMTTNRRGMASPQLEALDIAKRLTHDDAAELLQSHFQELRPDHNTARRLFTLLVVLTHDTTKIGQQVPRS